MKVKSKKIKLNIVHCAIQLLILENSVNVTIKIDTNNDIFYDQTKYLETQSILNHFV
jgi:hypothetical protein